MVVWKFKLEPGLRLIEMPEGSIILSAIAQRDDLFVYALCDGQAETEEREFRSMATGFEDVDGIEDWTFVDTVYFDDGLVFHVFYKSNQD
ncbi:MAG: DUF7352 domain-containing protein [Candidatus Thorarchaeota archaeon]